MTITMTDEMALVMKYAVSLARAKCPEFKNMTDSEIISRLIEVGLEVSA
ncbi:MAG: hypothetical protein HFF66_00745 [Oscillospiraceae bacterium]|jgi:hypothetical protein|nr:hypothetical protein [Oscillospiraceae bacterium]